MLSQNKLAWIASATLSCSSLFAATSAFAAALPCVQRGIDWNNAHSLNYVSFSLVALHETQVAAYASGRLRNSNCTREPYALGTVSCLVTSGSVDALLSDRNYINQGGGLQPFDVNKPLLLAVNVIPSDTLAQVHLRQPNATYDFDPRCVGNLLTGNDQWGNHWAVAFSLGVGPR
jgi:hypothetical protein